MAMKSKLEQPPNSRFLQREDIFATSKILSPGTNRTATIQSLLDSIYKIGGTNTSAYNDLMLIHNAESGPAGIKMMWQAIEKLYEQGKFKSIGVSNSGIKQIEA